MTLTSLDIVLEDFVRVFFGETRKEVKTRFWVLSGLNQVSSKPKRAEFGTVDRLLALGRGLERRRLLVNRLVGHDWGCC